MSGAMLASRPMTKKVAGIRSAANSSQKRWTAMSGTARRARSSRGPWRRGMPAWQRRPSRSTETEKSMPRSGRPPAASRRAPRLLLQVVDVVADAGRIARVGLQIQVTAELDDGILAPAVVLEHVPQLVVRHRVRGIDVGCALERVHRLGAATLAVLVLVGDAELGPHRG